MRLFPNNSFCSFLRHVNYIMIQNIAPGLKNSTEFSRHCVIIQSSGEYLQNKATHKNQLWRLAHLHRLNPLLLLMRLMLCAIYTMVLMKEISAWKAGERCKRYRQHQTFSVRDREPGKHLNWQSLLEMICLIFWLNVKPGVHQFQSKPGKVIAIRICLLRTPAPQSC